MSGAPLDDWTRQELDRLNRLVAQYADTITKRDAALSSRATEIGRLRDVVTAAQAVVDSNDIIVSDKLRDTSAWGETHGLLDNLCAALDRAALSSPALEGKDDG